MIIKPRNFNPVAEKLRADFFNLLELSNEAFEVLILKAKIESEGYQTDSQEVVGTLEQKESKLLYQSAIESKAIELINNENELMFMTASNEWGDTEQADVSIMFFSEPEVPEQSIVLVNDQVGEKVVTSAYYVLDSLPLNRHGTAGKKHRLIPFRGDIGALLKGGDVASSEGAAPKDDEFGDLTGLLAQ